MTGSQSSQSGSPIFLRNAPQRESLCSGRNCGLSFIVLSPASRCV